ncbi:hypothetical protein B9Z55_003102 [Caenorhabditis nigoni]|uniref:Uncharacterized protein n=1 Tax=Caenorhabditis nigoni TaxID=1611254 RepID=A0A2G5VNH3_9PELO|nr:hypothetical protein B9Z55_003102 [Caenorhabditis nigoni]
MDSEFSSGSERSSMDDSKMVETSSSRNSPTAEAPKIPAFLQGNQAQRLLFQKLAEQAKEKFEKRKTENN